MGTRSAYTVRRFHKGDLCPNCQTSFINADAFSIYCKAVGCGHVEEKKKAHTTDNQQLHWKLNLLIKGQSECR